LRVMLTTSDHHLGGAGESVTIDADSVHMPARSAVIVAKNEGEMDT
jgi:hypothetical protein